MPAQLIVSVSGIRDTTLDQTQALADSLAKRGVPVSLLVAPRRKHGYRLVDDTATIQWLRARRSGGDAIVLHGYDQAATKIRRAEFAAIEAHEAALRLTAADRILEHVGLRTRIFAAPRWAASAGAIQALPGAGFRMNLGFTTIDDLRSGTHVRARVLGIGDGFPDDAWWCRMLIKATARTSRRGGVVRINVAAKHLTESVPRRALIDCIDLATHHGLRAVTYRDLLTTPVLTVAAAPTVGVA